MLTSVFLCGEFFLHVVVEVLLCIHRNRRFIRDRSGKDVPHRLDFHTAPEPRSASVTHPVLTFYEGNFSYTSRADFLCGEFFALKDYVGRFLASRACYSIYVGVSITQ